MAVDKERSLLRIRPTQGLRPFVHYHFKLVTMGVLLLAGALFSVAIARYFFFEYNAVLTTLFSLSRGGLSPEESEENSRCLRKVSHRDEQSSEIEDMRLRIRPIALVE